MATLFREPSFNLTIDFTCFLFTYKQFIFTKSEKIFLVLYNVKYLHFWSAIRHQSKTLLVCICDNFHCHRFKHSIGSLLFAKIESQRTQMGVSSYPPIGEIYVLSRFQFIKIHSTKSNLNTEAYSPLSNTHVVLFVNQGLYIYQGSFFSKIQLKKLDCILIHILLQGSFQPYMFITFLK